MQLQETFLKENTSLAVRGPIPSQTALPSVILAVQDLMGLRISPPFKSKPGGAFGSVRVSSTAQHLAAQHALPSIALGWQSSMFDFSSYRRFSVITR